MNYNWYFTNGFSYNIVRGARYSGKWFSQSYNNIKRKSIILNKLWFNIIIKNSYFSLKPNIKPEKCSIIKITMYKEIQFYGMLHWYPPIMFEPTLPKNMQQMKQWITRLNDVNNYLKEESKWLNKQNIYSHYHKL